MKPPREWNEEYLLSLPSLEPTNLDFKGRGSLDLTLPNVNRDRVKNELSVELSAFANSGGGLIIFGVKNPIAGQPLEIDDGGVDIAMKGSSTKEWLENVIPSLTEYSLPSFEIHVIEGKRDNSRILPGRAVFVVEVPDSEKAPHQAYDKKYYVRLGGTSQPIGHQFVMDIAGRRQYPIMRLSLQIQSNLTSDVEEEWQFNNGTRIREVDLLVIMENIGHVYAQYTNGFIYFPKNMVRSDKWENQPDKVKIIDGKEHFALEVNNSHFRQAAYRLEYRIIFPHLKDVQRVNKILENFKQFDLEVQRQEIKWELYADNAPPQAGIIQMKDVPLLSRNGQEIYGQ